MIKKIRLLFFLAMFFVIMLVQAGIIEARSFSVRSRLKSLPSGASVYRKDMAAREFALKEGLNLKLNANTGVFVFSGKDISIRGLLGDNCIIVNGEFYALKHPVRIEAEGFLVPAELSSIYIKISRKQFKKPVRKKATASSRVKYVSDGGIQKIVIDPGHGAHNLGAVGPKGTAEKNVVLDVANYLKEMLKDAGKDVVLTRARDVFVTLANRSGIANRAKPDLFVSIHANAARNRSASGCETFYLSEKTDDYSRAIASMENKSFNLDEEEKDALLNKGGSAEQIVKELKYAEIRKESIDLAKIVQKELADVSGLKDRGVKSANFYVLKTIDCPSVLVEVGFLTNPTEEKKLATKSYRKTIAKAIFNGIMSYDRAYKLSEGFTK